MPNFTSGSVEEPKSFFQKLKPSTIIPLIVIFLFLYLAYYFAPSKITSAIPNPFGKKSIITTIGTGSITAKPDIAIFAVTIGSTSTTSNNALLSAKDKVKTLSNLLKKQGLSNEDIKISAYNIQPTTSTGELIYIARATVIVTSPNISIAETLQRTALSQGGSLSAPLNYSVNKENRIALEKQARKKAIENAYQKAQNIASIYNKTLGKMLSYAEEPSSNSSLTNSSSSNRPGEIEVFQAIQVTYQTK